jgi:16S rRNA (uracil1498-N3)-methyltransferase
VTRPLFSFPGAAEAPVGASVVLDGDEGRHAAAAMRLRAGEGVTLTDGRGVALHATVVAVGRAHVDLLVEDRTVSEPPDLAVTVVQATAKRERGERAVELMTEVGVSRIVPWQAERSVSRWQGKADRARAKWQAVADAAAKQSRRPWWPQVGELVDLAGVSDIVSRADQAFVLHESAQQRMVEQLAAKGTAANGEVVLVVGPEGGLTDAELSALTTSGATAVRLGPTVLRTSTAGLVAATLVLATTVGWRSAQAPEEGASRE